MLVGIKAKLALYAHTALPLAGQVSESEAQEFFSSQTFKDHLKHLEFKDKTQGLVFDRFDAVIKGMGMLGKLLSRRR